ncbi:hypothetical protein BDV93DRAFT_510167 [Ceratobasidium sp. AG-I]|nr:hypothetical protein BDV93DRAFT_510167 [Ceratobasidium sp. AG-I]
MLEKIKRKAKEKGRHYANKLLGPPSFERLTAESSSVSIGDTAATNIPVPTPVLVESVSDPDALAPPGASPQVVSISASQPTIASPALPSTHIPLPASQTNDSGPSAARDRAPIRATSLGSIMSPGAERSAKSTTWSGLKTLLDLLNVCSDAFGPFKSAVGGISKLIDIYDAKAEAGKRYKELHSELDELFRDLSGYLEESMPPAMKSSLDRLTRGIERKVGFVQGKEDRSWIKGAAEAMEDADEILECYRQIQRLFERFLIDASVSNGTVVLLKRASC